MSKPSIEKVMEEARRWAEIRGVAGVAESEEGGEPCILVLVSGPEAGRKIPATFRGYRVVVRESGEITALGGGPPGKRSH